MPRPPNILYLVCHDLGQHLGCYDALVESPRLDAFATQGMRCDRAFCNSPACTPSRACAMTGRYAHTTGAIGLAHMGWPLPDAERTIVDHFNDAGWQTAHFGLAHERLPESMRYEIEGERHWDDWRVENAVDGAIGFLRDGRDRRRPFYLNIGTHEVHKSGWGDERRSRERYGDPVPAEDVWLPGYCFDTPAQRAEFGRFQAAIRFFDRHVGRLLDAVDEVGLRDDTLVVVTTDHGIASNRGKGTLYDRGVEIALLLRLPGVIEPGRISEDLLQNIDLAPTLLELAGLPIPREMQGRSFAPLLRGESYRAHEAIFLERNFHGEARPASDGDVDLYDPIRSVRTPEFHYIRRFLPDANDPTRVRVEPPGPPRQRPAEELYHLRHDPGELCDVARQPEYRHVKAELSARLDRWMRETDDFLLRDGPPARPCEPGWGRWSQLRRTAADTVPDRRFPPTGSA